MMSLLEGFIRMHSRCRRSGESEKGPLPTGANGSGYLTIRRSASPGRAAKR